MIGLDIPIYIFIAAVVALIVALIALGTAKAAREAHPYKATWAEGIGLMVGGLALLVCKLLFLAGWVTLAIWAVQTLA